MKHPDKTRPFWLQGITINRWIPTEKPFTKLGRSSTVDDYRTTPMKSHRHSTTLSEGWKTSETTKIPSKSQHDEPLEELKRNVSAINPSVAFNVKDVVNSIVIQLNINGQMTDGEMVNTTLNFTKLIGDLDQFLNKRHSESPRNEMKPSAICEAAGDSILLKSLFCSPSTAEHEKIPALLELTKRLAPEIIANLTEALNSTEVFDNDNQTDSSTESSTMSTVLMEHFTTLLNSVNVSTSSEVTSNWSFLTNTTEISMQALMVDLSRQLQNATLSRNLVSAVSLLNITVPSGWLESLIENTDHNNSTDQIDFDNKIHKVITTTEAVPTTVEQRTSPTTTSPKEIDVLNKDFWKTRANPVKPLQRESGPSLKTIPVIGRRWRTVVPPSSLYRPLPKTMRRVATPNLTRESAL